MVDRPEGPSTIVLAHVGVSAAYKVQPAVDIVSRLIQLRTFSAPARVLPAPRPLLISQVRHVPAGSSWSVRAQKGQS